eukprot:gene9207-9356_t
MKLDPRASPARSSARGLTCLRNVATITTLTLAAIIGVAGDYTGDDACTGCISGTTGPCTLLGVNLCAGYINEATQECPNNYVTCTTTTTPSTTTTTTTVTTATDTTATATTATATTTTVDLGEYTSDDACLTCAAGTAGPCIIPILNLCSRYEDVDSEDCGTGKERCADSFTTTSTTTTTVTMGDSVQCDGCVSGTFGPCIFPGINLCANYVDEDTQQCPNNYVACTTSTSSTTTTTTSTATTTTVDLGEYTSNDACLTCALGTAGINICARFADVVTEECPQGFQTCTTTTTTATTTTINLGEYTGDDACLTCALSTAGPCIIPFVNLCSRYEDVDAKDCGVGKARCDDDATTLTTTTIKMGEYTGDDACLTCATGTSGPCIIPFVNLCSRYEDVNEENCGSGKDRCADATTTITTTTVKDTGYIGSNACSNCAAGTDGPCKIPGVELCLRYVDDAKTCPVGSEQCTTTSTATATTSTSTTGPYEGDDACPGCVSDTSGPCMLAGVSLCARYKDEDGQECPALYNKCTTTSTASTTTTTTTTTFEFTSMLMLTVSVKSEVGFAGFAPQRLSKGSSDSTYTGSYLTGGWNDAGKYTVALEGFGSKSMNAATERFAATEVWGILRSATVYLDSRDVTATFQVRDETTYSVLPSAVTIVIKVAPAGALGTASGDSSTYTKEVVCPGSSGRQMTDVVCNGFVRLPEVWFAADVGDGSVDVTYEIKGTNVVIETWSVNTVSEKALSSVLSNSIEAKLPTRALYQGDTFTVPIYSLFPLLLDAFQIKVTVGAGLTIESFAVAKEGGSDAFQGEFKIRTDKLDMSTSFTRIDTNPSTSAVANPELLGSVTFRVSSSAGAGFVSVGVALEYASDVKDNKVAPTFGAPVSVIYTREAVSISGSGNVHIFEDAIRGILPFVGGSGVDLQATAGELVNTAVLNGVRVRRNIAVAAITERGVVVDATSEGVCPGTSGDVLKVVTNVNGNCAVELDGTETIGSDAYAILVKAHGFERSVPFRVYYPQLPITMEMEDSLLETIDGLPASADDCSSYVIQSTAVIATATFKSGAHNFTGDVSSVVASTLTTLDGTVATVDVSSGIVTGVASGTTLIMVTSPAGVTVGGAPVSVNTGASVEVAVLDPIAITSLSSVSADEASPFDRLSIRAIEISANSAVLKYEGDTITIVASAVLSDGQRFAVSIANGLTLSSTKQKAIEFRSATSAVATVPKSPEGGAGNLVQATWKPFPECSTAATISAFVEVTVTPPSASKLTLTSTVLSLVPRNDLAAKAGLAEITTSAQLSVSLTFPDKVQKNLEGDERTSYEIEWISGSENLFTVSTVGLVTANENGLIGTAKITASFEGQVVMDSIVITVGKFDRLAVNANPEPAYPGSSTVAISKVSVIDGTSPLLYQQAKLTTVMYLTDARSFALLASTVQYNANVQGSATTASHVSFATNVMSASAAGLVNIVGVYESTDSQVLPFEVSDDRIAVLKVDDAFLSTGANMQKITSFTGAKGSASAQ